MPIVFKQDIAGGWLALWQITESEEELYGLVSAADIASCELMRSAKRRRDRLASRALLRELLPDAGEVRYNGEGAPRIARGHICVSHTMGCWAALIYRQESGCAIDIEYTDRDVSLAAGTVEEWCAREARHKYGDRTASVNYLYRHGLCIAYI